jgi:hypothetical protein
MHRVREKYDILYTANISQFIITAIIVLYYFKGHFQGFLRWGNVQISGEQGL